MEKRRCPGCMGLTDQQVCPVCAWQEGQQNAPHQLAPGTVLGGRYILGRALGQGGFGITYLGWDQQEGREVAVKEFFPGSMVTRDTAQSSQVQFFTTNDRERYSAGRDRFLREARSLAKLSNIPEIVNICSCFEENDTAYIVMEFVRGSTMVQYVRSAGGRLSAEETLRILKPVMAALDAVHKAGLVHRDISPDNIILEPLGGAKLIDFGAARVVENPDADRALTSSTEAIVKQGFAPGEQYSSRGSIGPWSDEYALCATVYYCLTGKVPPDAVSRSMGDAELDWNAVPGLTARQRAALEKGMSVSARNRYPSVGELARELFTEEGPPLPKPNPRPAPKPGKAKWIAAAAAVLAAAAVGIVLLTSPGGGKADPPENPAPAAVSGTLPTGTAPQTLPAAQPEPVREIYTMAAAEDLSEVDSSAWEDQTFWGQTEYPRKQVRTVSFHDSMEGVPEGAWDVSEAGDGTVLAWMDGSSLHVAANGRIAPNSNASWLFAAFSGLTAVDFGSCFDMSHVTDASRMFFRCGSLTSLDLSGQDMGNVTDMSFLFNSCESLTSLKLGSLDTSRVTNMRLMFYGCKSLTSLDLGGLDTSHVTDMNAMFYGCSRLTHLDLSGWDTSNVTDMSFLFTECGSLTALNLRSFNTSNVTDMCGMFQDCDKLKILDLSNFDTSKVTDMRQMFYSCGSLAKLNLESFDTANVSAMAHMFYGCSMISELICTDSRILDAYQHK